MRISDWSSDVCSSDLAMRARTRPASLRPIRSRSATSVLAIERDAIKPHAVIDEAEAQPPGALLLELLQLGIDAFEQLAGLDVAPVNVVRFGHRTGARKALAEIMSTLGRAVSRERG